MGSGTALPIRVETESGSYPIFVNAGALDELPDHLANLCPAHRYAIVCDSGVARHFGPRVVELVRAVSDTSLFVFPAGEWNKTRETWAELTDAIARWGMGRDGAVITLGGGVAGDLGGFIAATYNRGVPYVQLPTSLLAMIDASIGGKTGIDTPLGKNLVGAFHHPRFVLADLDTLATLPRHQLFAGVAEALKHGAVADKRYFEDTTGARSAIESSAPEALFHLVRRSVEIKVAVVGDDEREAGRRAILNFGHSIGHGLEVTGGYALLHGEAVAIGMIAEARVGEHLGITEQGTAELLREAVEAFELPNQLPDGTDPDRVLEAIAQDKKNREGSARFALVRRIGQPARTETGVWTFEVTEPLIMQVLKSIV